MAPLSPAALFVTLLAVASAGPRPTNEEWKATRAADDKKAAEATADQGKMAAVDKVVNMLDTLTQKVLAEGEAEAASYNKFACFCKTMQGNKEDAIKEEKDNKASLTAAINKLSDGRKDDDKSIASLEKEISDTNDDMKAANEDNADDMKKYNAEKADLSSAIDGITNAMKTLKASKPSMLQLKSATDTVEEVLAMADALGLGGAPVAALLQQAPEVAMENYKFHSSSVIDTLEKLLADFRGRKSKSDATEVTRLAEHDMQMQKDTDKIKAKTLELEQTQKAKSDKTSEIAENSQEMSTESAKLLDDQEYLKNLYNTCKKKADTWDQRSKVRADELSAITAATTIIKGAVSESTSRSSVRLAQKGVSIRIAQALARDDSAMESFEEAAEEKEGSAPSTFLQKRSVSRHNGVDKTVDMISKLLLSVGGKTKSTLLTSLASEITTEAPKGMEKIKTLVEELIKRLQAEAANEATQKGWCDKATSDATTKRTTASQTVDELDSGMAALEADRQILAEALEGVAKEIKDLKAAQSEADDMRKEEKTENGATVVEAEAGQKAVESAIAILEKFYKGAADAKVALVQAKKKSAQDPPDAGFENGEAYKGGQSDATGVLGMLSVIQSDFVRTIKETEKSEAQALQDYNAFSDTTKTSLTEKAAFEKARTKEKNDADSKHDTMKDQLKKQTDLLVNNIEELLELKKACVDTGMSYADRVARREEEVAALHKALCILTAYAAYGPDGAADQCS